jgi:hypothetical protein
MSGEEVCMSEYQVSDLNGLGFRVWELGFRTEGLGYIHLHRDRRQTDTHVPQQRQTHTYHGSDGVRRDLLAGIVFHHRDVAALLCPQTLHILLRQLVLFQPRLCACLRRQTDRQRERERKRGREGGREGGREEGRKGGRERE